MVDFVLRELEFRWDCIIFIEVIDEVSFLLKCVMVVMKIWKYFIYLVN